MRLTIKTKRGSSLKRKINYNPALVPHAQRLRKHMTPEERHLWYDFLKKLPVTVNRQKNIGNYIVDFYIFSAATVIEVDGVQHKTQEHMASDRQRDQELQRLGNRVLRYTNQDINSNFREVCQDILQHLGLSVDDLRNS